MSDERKMISVSEDDWKEIQELRETNKGLMKTLEKFGKADFSRVRVDGQNRITSYFEDTDEFVTVREDRERGNPSQHMKSELYKSYEGMRRQGYVPNEHFKSMGEFINLGFTDRDEFDKKCKSALGKLKAIQGLSESVGTEGGMLVMPEYATGIFDRVYSNDLLSRTDQYTVSGNSMTFPRSIETSRANGSRGGGIRGYWVKEGGTITKSTPKLGELNLRLKKLAVLVYLTEELVEDAGPAAEAWVTRQAAQEFEFMIGDALVNGSGAGQPLGILNAPALISVSAEGGQSATTILSANIDNMWARRFAGTDNYIWLKHQDTHPQLSKLSQSVGTGGQVLYRPPGGLAEAPYATILGKPCMDTEFNATLGTVGDLILTDMSRIVTITKGGIAQAVSTHVEFLTDQRALKFTMRIDGAPWEHSAVTPFKGNNTQSPFVTLATRS